MGQASTVRRKRAIQQYNKMPNIAGVNDSKQRNEEKPLEVGEKLIAPEFKGRTFDVLGRKIASGVFLGKHDYSATQDVNSENAFPVAQPMTLLPVPVSNTLDSYMENPSYYMTNSSADCSCSCVIQRCWIRQLCPDSEDEMFAIRRNIDYH
ncbi:hypothetical protein DPMN_053107 [Dreissena polymorpha]|uniref:Uncharacterized protein n=1 Tax=Dreissena polymorpha TaxID=45954 RepID=A0A9D3XZD3_DREPO|nr:hypothetical protein DPMN_190889 [Dreissena polymorpha]KAH3727179.1 hypothetical protein DPMN_053107 [Dreissena polymorpha]